MCTCFNAINCFNVLFLFICNSMSISNTDSNNAINFYIVISLTPCLSRLYSLTLFILLTFFSSFSLSASLALLFLSHPHHFIPFMKILSNFISPCLWFLVLSLSVRPSLSFQRQVLKNNLKPRRTNQNQANLIGQSKWNNVSVSLIKPSHLSSLTDARKRQTVIYDARLTPCLFQRINFRQ